MHISVLDSLANALLFVNIRPFQVISAGSCAGCSTNQVSKDILAPPPLPFPLLHSSFLDLSLQDFLAIMLVDNNATILNPNATFTAVWWTPLSWIYNTFYLDQIKPLLQVQVRELVRPETNRQAGKQSHQGAWTDRQSHQGASMDRQSHQGASMDRQSHQGACMDSQSHQGASLQDFTSALRTGVPPMAPCCPCCIFPPPE